MMHIYKFRILLEDNDQFFREIDIRANQTFEDFHQALVKSAGFDNKEMASFYLCDSNWNKQQEICLCNMSIPDEEVMDDDEVRAKKQIIPVKCMADTRLKDEIIDPHQRMIYVFDFLKMHTFYIELFKVFAADPGKHYPFVARSRGKVYQVPVAPKPDELETGEEETDSINYEDLIIADNEIVEDELFEGFYDDSTFN